MDCINKKIGNGESYIIKSGSTQETINIYIVDNNVASLLAGNTNPGEKEIDGKKVKMKDLGDGTFINEEGKIVDENNQEIQGKENKEKLFVVLMKNNKSLNPLWYIWSVEF